jgi:MIT (microtubule interacting and transport) domain
MGNPSFLDRAISTVRKAVEFDEAGNPQEAYKTYMNARTFAPPVPSRLIPPQLSCSCSP